MVRSKTVQNIDKINYNLSQIASTFGTESLQYENYVASISMLDTRKNKAGVIQVRNNKNNRSHYKAVSNATKHRVNVKSAKKESQAALDKYNKNKRTKNKISSIKDFEKRRKDIDDKINEVYMVEEMANELGIDFNAYLAFRDDDYLFAMKYDVNLVQNDDNYNFVPKPPNIKTVYDAKIDAIVSVNTDTGEVIHVYN